MDPQADGRGLRPQAPPSGGFNMDSPSMFPLTGREVFRLTALAAVGVTLTATVRTLDQRADVQYQVFTLVVPSGRAITTLDYPIGDGAFLDVTVRATTGGPIEGQAWVAADLVIGLAGEKQKTLTLGYGYTTANKPLFLPFGQNTGPLEGAGALRSITGTTPGAGVEITEVVPAGARWQVIGFRYRLVTSAVVANRQTALKIDDGANIYLFAGGDVVQAASGTNNYSYGTGYSPFGTNPTNAISRSLPTPLLMLAGHRISTQTVALDAGDQYSTVQYLVREWLEA